MRIEYPRPSAPGTDSYRAWGIRLLVHMSPDPINGMDVWKTISNAAGTLSLDAAIRAGYNELRPSHRYDRMYDFAEFAECVKANFVGNASPRAVLQAAVRGELTFHGQGKNLNTKFFVVSNPHAPNTKRPFVAVLNHPEYGWAYQKRFETQRTPDTFASVRQAVKVCKS